MTTAQTTTSHTLKLRAAPRPVPSGPLPTAAAMPPVPSDSLLQGRKAMEISHNGSVYRLQATKLGKLILTK